MDPTQAIGPGIPSLPPVEPLAHRVDPERRKREQQERERKKREQQWKEPAEPEEDDGRPHVDISV
jgi:hypothetical protein